ncbi:SOUL heme-binding protein [Glaciecola sp. KUL10]|nr:SOUL heme-binding protein [Glaciecola sp. KUL10]
MGDSGVENAPYTLIQRDEAKNIEIRNYDSMILVSTSTQDDGRNGAFRRLFAYITGDNQGAAEIAMTAPVFMDSKADKNTLRGSEIAMTAPVFMNEDAMTPTMAFVMPDSFTLLTTPKPNNPAVSVSEVNDYKVAVITFSWTLSDRNVEKHTSMLEEWLDSTDYEIVGPKVLAGYNGPLTLPMMRRNEILIPIK